MDYVKKIGILEAKDFSTTALGILGTLGNVFLYSEDKDINNFVKDKDILFVRLKHKIDVELINNAAKLKYICSPTTGLNHIDEVNGVKIISLKGEDKFLEDIRATSEHVIGLHLALLRNYKYAFLDVDNSDWNRDAFKGREIFNSTVGIIGYGRIGKLLKKYYDSFGANVIAYDIKEEIDDDVVFTHTIEDLIRQSDVVILCANYSPGYNAFFDRDYFDLLRGKYFINASRGELINEPDLISFIISSDFKGVALDVISNETDILNSEVMNILRIIKGKNVIVTPHIGGATFDSMSRTEIFIAEKLYQHIKRIGI